MCKDSALQYLNHFGYNVIKLPRQDMDPLLVLAGKRGNLTCLGPVSQFIIKPTRQPEIKRDQLVADIAGKKTNKLDIGIGLNLLSGFLSVLGFATGKLNNQYSKARTVQFVFNNVLADGLYLTDVDDFLLSGQPRTDSLLQEEIDEEGEAYIVYETIKSNSFGIIAYDSKNTAIQVDVDGIQKILGVSSGIKVSRDADYAVVYKGGQHLYFGFKAVKFWIEKEDGAVKFRIKPADQSMTYKSLDYQQRQQQLQPQPVIFKKGEFVDVKFPRK